MTEDRESGTVTMPRWYWNLIIEYAADTEAAVQAVSN